MADEKNFLLTEKNKRKLWSGLKINGRRKGELVTSVCKRLGPYPKMSLCLLLIIIKDFSLVALPTRR
jgi:hypothetical protein